jgi:hypothetical protein
MDDTRKQAASDAEDESDGGKSEENGGRCVFYEELEPWRLAQRRVVTVFFSLVGLALGGW